MASACVNNVAVSQEFPSYGCFNPRASFSREDTRRSSVSGSASSEMQKKTNQVTEEESVAIGGGGDFEFRLEDPVGMLPADELFSDGKLLTKQTAAKCKRTEAEMEISSGGENAATATESCLFSPKAPRCSSRWKEFLGFKRFSQKPNPNPNPRSSSSSSSSFKQFLNRSSRSSSSSSSSDAASLLPLLKDSDYESLSISSSRMSLSSSSSSHDHEDLPRLSLDSEKHNLTANPFAPPRSLNPNPPRMRLVTTSRTGRSPMRRRPEAIISRGVSVDSPRLNSSGKIIFQSLERSSSSPSSFNNNGGGPYRNRAAIERSYSSNVRVTPVLNVPVCSIRGGSVIFNQFFSSSSSQQNRASSSSSSSSHNNISRGRNSTDRN